MRVTRSSGTSKIDQGFLPGTQNGGNFEGLLLCRLSTNDQQAQPLQTHRALWVRNATSGFIFHFSTVSYVVDLKGSE